MSTQTSARPKHLWRVEALYADGTAVVRHYQSEAAARDWRKQRLAGYPEQVGYGMEGDETREAIAPAVSVRITKSAPIVFEQVVVDGSD